MTREERRGLRVQQLEGWRASGLTQEAYCKRESISYETFRRWRRKLGDHGWTAPLMPHVVPVRIAEGSGSVASARVHDRADVLAQPVEVVLASGRRLRFGDGLDETSLARLIRLLEVLPC
ncbi:MAG: hypothetical protein GEV05_09525 [Betaproteobacteria bacterium]|nr:hypothetical protein [Betaproteobacteria bacterium]